MTLATADTELAARGYSRFLQARRFVWLNTAKNRFEDYMQTPWPWLRTTITGNSPLTVSDLRRVLTVVNTASGETLPMADPDLILKYLDDSLAQTGTPTMWYLASETSIGVYPASVTALSVRYVKFSPELASGDSPLIPARYQQTWIDLAECDVLRYGVKDSAAANALEEEAFRRLNEIATVYLMQDQPLYNETVVAGASIDG